MRKLKSALLAVAAMACLGSGTANAALTTFQQYVGNYGYSSDGFGSTSQSGTISASVPIGSTVVAAYLYTSTFSSTLAGVGGTLNGTAVSYTSLGTTVGLTAGRSDVTSIVKPLIDGGPGGIYNFTVTETSTSQDGEALVVIYTNPALAVSTVGILDGFSEVTGDATSINFADPLNPAAPGFFAEMSLGIGFSCCSQSSTVTINGTTITTNAGNNDDGVGFTSNGQLITVGGFNDPFSPMLPSYGDDHERYNLVPQITAGDTSINITTLNPSRNDNIFLAIVHAAGRGGVNTPPPSQVPEPGTLSLLAFALAGLGRVRYKAKRDNSFPA